MEYEYSPRAYQRGTHFNCTVRISRDGTEWHHARVTDLSSGGLCLVSTVEYEVGGSLWFDLEIAGFLSEFKVKTQGKIRNKKTFGKDNHYGIEFIGLSQDMKIRIDENVIGDRIVGRGTYGF